MLVLKKVIIVILACIGLVFPFTQLHAETGDVRTDFVLQECDGASLTSIVQLPTGQYDTYIENLDGINGGTADVYLRNSQGSCTLLGQVTSQTKGSFARITSNGPVDNQEIIIISPSGIETVTTKPAIVFMPVQDGPCADPHNCLVTYQDTEYVLRPKKLSFSEDTVNVGLYLPLADTGIKEVLYAVDGNIVRRSETIEPFDERFVPGGSHDVATIIVLENGQSLIDTATVKQGVDGDYLLYLTSIFFRNSATFLTIAAGLGAIVLILSMTAVAKWWKRRQFWQKTHIASKSYVQSDQLKKAGPYKAFYRDQAIDFVLRHRKVVIVIVLLFIGYSLTTKFVFVRFRVNGVSMEPTLHNKSRHFMSKLPIYSATFNNRDYIPARGDIVVVQKDENNLFDDTIKQKKSYVVKRVIALPGETVLFTNDRLIVKNEQNPEGFDIDTQFHWIPDTTGTAISESEVKLEPGEVYIVGDNRDDSIDSRVFGPVRADQIIGKVISW